jgi:hypothetical protein
MNIAVGDENGFIALVISLLMTISIVDLLKIIPLQKPRVVKDYIKISEALQEQIKLHYPYGFEKELISFKNAEGKFVSALPYETDDHYYLIRMTPALAIELIEEDDDYDEDGNLKDDVFEEYQEKYD